MITFADARLCLMPLPLDRHSTHAMIRRYLMPCLPRHADADILRFTLLELTLTAA